MKTKILGLLILTAGCAPPEGAVGEGRQAERYDGSYRRTEPQMLSAGLGHACTVHQSDGKVYCWGENYSSQLGDGATAFFSAPVLASRVTTPMVAISAGGGHTCGLTTGGEVQCWGSNSSGQVGNGTTGGTVRDPASILTSVVDIAAGKAHTCALLASGVVKCWGANDHRQLGDGTTVSLRNVPVTVDLEDQTGHSMVDDIVDLTAGDYHTCALRADGSTLCWGERSAGQVGAAGAIYPSNTGSLEGVEAAGISAGGSHTCAVQADGTVWCVGNNTYAQLGIATTDNAAHFYPSQVLKWNTEPLTDVVSVSAGFEHTCALVKGGTIYCWGRNQWGQIGYNATNTPFDRAVRFTDIDDAVAVDAGKDFTCVVRANNAVSCWGRNNTAQLGGGFSTTYNVNPLSVNVGRDHGVLDIDLGWWHVCQRNADGTADCWGLNQDGQLGNGTTDPSTSPTQVSNLSNVVAIATGGDHSCALRADNTVSCWGNDWSGAVGDGNTSGVRTSPTPVIGLSDAVSIDAGAIHTCVVTLSGLVKCWGSDSDAQLGDGLGTIPGRVVTVSGLTNAFAVSTGEFHTCALHAGGISCWGRNTYGQVGVSGAGDQHTPQAVGQLLGGESAIAAGGNHTCALTSGGQVECWGRGDSGQLGDGYLMPAGQFSSHPVTATITNAVAIAAGSRHTCAIKANGTLHCWGDNSHGQLGLTGGARSVPTLVPVGANGTKVVAVAAAVDATCVLTDANEVICYGNI